MASRNPFDLLVDDDNDDVTQLIAKLPVAAPAKKAPAAGGLTAKPAPKKAPAVQEFKTERGGGRAGSRGAGRGGRGGRGFNRDSANNENTNGNTNGFNGGYMPTADGEVDKFSERRGFSSSRGAYRGGRRGGYANGDMDGERPRRVFERRSMTGRGNDLKRDGAGRGNWGSPTAVPKVLDEPVAEPEKNEEPEKPAAQEDGVDANKENPAPEAEVKEPEEKEMTLEEYEKVLEEKRKALQTLRAEERKVGLDKDLEKMQLLSSKKSEEEIFVKLGSEKEKRKDAEKEEKAKKSLSINEFLKPTEEERNYSGGRGRGRGRGGRAGYGGGNRINDVAPAIEDVKQFPSLGVK
uniref:RGG repeats nuclear RNA binding protein A-like n=1 Tax=Erigeron canadensis TaxID=72917 RepID=UPI001CB9B995|nr:RGG repeats nuclear RNA binding protein A-like [Erigeron canadensis]